MATNGYTERKTIITILMGKWQSPWKNGEKNNFVNPNFGLEKVLITGDTGFKGSWLTFG